MCLRVVTWYRYSIRILMSYPTIQTAALSTAVHRQKDPEEEVPQPFRPCRGMGGQSQDLSA